MFDFLFTKVNLRAFPDNKRWASARRLHKTFLNTSDTVMHVETITVGRSREEGLKIHLSLTKIPLRSRCLQHFHRVSLELQLSGGGEVF